MPNVTENLMFALKVGTRIRYTIPQLNGGTTTQPGTYIERPFVWGYELPSGAWSVSRLSGEDCQEAWFIGIRPKHKQKTRYYRISRLLWIEEGWQ